MVSLDLSLQRHLTGSLESSLQDVFANCSNEVNIHCPPSGQSPCRKIRYNLVNPCYMETCSPPRREAASGRKSFQQFQLARSSQLLAQPPQKSEPQPSFSVSLDIWSNVFGDLVRRTPSSEKVVSLEALVKFVTRHSLHGPLLTGLTAIPT